MKMENLEIRQLQQVANKDRIVEGYALKFGTPSENLGGFIETIDKRALDGVDLSDVRCFVDHDPTKILGRTKSETLTLEVDDVGLKFRCLLPNTTLGNDTLELVTRGDVSQCSFGFTVADDFWTRGGQVEHRTIKQIGRMFEISLVSIPAYNDTDVTVATRSLENAKVEYRKRELQLQLDLMGLA